MPPAAMAYAGPDGGWAGFEGPLDWSFHWRQKRASSREMPRSPCCWGGVPLPELGVVLLLPLPEPLLLLEGREEFWRKDLLPLVGFLGEGGTT